MSYTITIADVVEQIWENGHPDETHSIFTLAPWSTSLANIDEKIEYARPVIFSFNYECYGDEEDKKQLEQHILRKYFTREICCSSMTRWQLYLYSRLTEIMPRYNALYNANLKVIENALDVLNPYNIKESKERDINTNSKDEQSSTNSNSATNNNTYNDVTNTKGSGTDINTTKATTKYSDTPQALMQSNKDYLTNLTEVQTNVNDNYADEGETKNQGSNNSTSSSNVTSNSNGNASEVKSDNYVKTIKGNMSKYNAGELLQSYANAIMNIEELITNDLNDLFYQIY